MRIDKISVENFRLFEKREFSFHPQFNLIVGVNGSGKSSLLRALLVCISGQMLELFDDARGSEELFLITDDDVRQVIIGEDDLSYEKAGTTHISGEFLLLLENTTTQKYSVVSCTDGRLLPHITQRVMDIDVIKIPSDWPIHTNFIAPLYVSYGCNRLWKNQKNEKIFENAMQAKYSRRDGYKDWMQAQADDIQLIEWLLKQNIIAFQEGKESLGWRVLNKALKNCFEGFEKLSFMAKEGDLVVHDIDDKGNPCRKLFKHMSDGQRCMIGLIGDMVRRAVLLNPQLGDEILEKTAGVVLIDELDLHLHPTWQRRIIDDLRCTFPQVQFICTTHSPFLIQSLRSGDELLMLDDNSNFEGVNKSIEDIIETVQGISMPQQSKRFQDMMAVAEEYYHKLHQNVTGSNEEIEKLRQELDKMTVPYSDDPAFVAFLKMERETLLAQQGVEE